MELSSSTWATCIYLLKTYGELPLNNVSIQSAADEDDLPVEYGCKVNAAGWWAGRALAFAR
jgi:hypothetical protein